jgi:acyl dehydratase
MSNSAPGWEIGQLLEERELPEVARLPLIRYAGASGDYNPIHTIDEEAHRAGLPGVIQHGMLTMAQRGSLLSPHLEHGFIEHFQTRFVGMLFLGDRLRIGGKVTRAEKDGTNERFYFDLFARTSDGRTVAKGSIRFLWLG